MIRPVKLKIEGFSNLLGPVKVTFRGRGVRIIKGANGEGKTTLLSALSWVLYGKPLKAGSTIETWEQKRGDDYLGTKVAFTFEKKGTTYKVIRCKDYKGHVLGKAGKNRLILFEGQEEYTDYRNKADLQNYLVGLLGYDYDLFINATVFPQKITRFIELKGAQRKEILEEIFDLSAITKGYAIASKEAKELASSVHIKEIEILNLETSLSDIADALGVLEKIQEEKDKTIKEKRAHIATLLLEQSVKPVKVLDKQAEITSQVKALRNSASYQDYERAKSDLAKVESRLLANRKTRKKLEKSISDVKYTKNGECSVCGQELGNKAKKKSLAHYKAELLKIEAAIKVNLEDLEKYTSEVKKGKGTQKAIDAKHKEKFQNLKDYRDYKAKLSDYNNDVKEIENAEDDLETWVLTDHTEDIEAYKADIKSKEDSLYLKGQTLRKDQMNYRVAKFMADKVFSKVGFKSFLMDMALREINSILSEYESKIGFRVELEVAQNAYKDVLAIIYINDYPVIYQDLSGGQAQLVNAAISLSLAEFMASKGAMEFLALDEITSNLDAKNQERVGDIIAKIGQEKEVWVITHSPDLVIPGSEIVHISGDNQVINTLTI